jgi:hydroxymethylglutaryl-CoA lyase
VGFDYLDFGSFVSPKAIPQLRDTEEVLALLNFGSSKTKLLAIVANQRGADQATAFEKVDAVGFPFSVSETFQLRNTNKTILQSLDEVKGIQELCVSREKELVIYLSMGFGNPYGDDYSAEIVAHWASEIAGLGIKTISLADTIGAAKSGEIESLFSVLIPEFESVTFGAHFHSTPESRIEKVAAAWKGGCRRFDAALNGFGGCPFAEDELVGNLATESLLEFLGGIHAKPDLNMEAYQEAQRIALEVFSFK